MNRKLVLAVNYAVSGALVYILATRFDFASAVSAVSRADVRVIAAAALVSLVFRLLFMPYIWKSVLDSCGVEVQFGDLASANAVSLPLKFLLPFKVTEFVRAAGLKVFANADFSVTLSSTLFTRFAAVAGTLLIMGAGLLLKGSAAAGALAIAGVAAGALAVLKLAERAGKESFIGGVAFCFSKIRGNGLTKIIAYSTLFQLGEVACAYMVFSALGAGMGFQDLLYPVSLMMLAGMVPVSVQGIGVREAVSVALFGGAFSPQIGLAAGALITLVHHVIPALAGALVWLAGFANRTFAGSVAAGFGRK